MHRFYSIYSEESVFVEFAEEVVKLIECLCEYRKQRTSAYIYSKDTLSDLNHVLENENEAERQYGIRRAKFIEGKLNSQAVELLGLAVKKTWRGRYAKMRPEFYHYDEISDMCRSHVCEKVSCRLESAKVYVHAVLQGKGCTGFLVDKLHDEPYKTTNLALVWLGNIAEETWECSIQRDFARRILSQYTMHFLDKNADILRRYRDFVNDELQKVKQKWSCKSDEIRIAGLLTGFEFLSQYLDASQCIDVDLYGIMLTRRMFHEDNLTPCMDSTCEFRHFSDEFKKKLAKYLSQELNVKEITTLKGVVFLDVASLSSTIQKYLIPLFDQWGVNIYFIFLRYVANNQECYSNQECYRSKGLGTNSDKHITKMANILDDGFPVSTTSPYGFNDKTLKPLGVEPTRRTWFHTMVTHAIRSRANQGT